MAIYINQTALRIKLKTQVDLGNIYKAYIRYKKPNSEIVNEWEATILDSVTGIIYYDIVDETELDKIGNWVFWAYIVFNDGSKAPGNPVTIFIDKEG